MTTLDKLKIGEEATIVSIKEENEILRSHILNMGLTPGVKISLIKTAPMGDPLEFRLRGYELTLRRESAAKIIIEDIKKLSKKSFIKKQFKQIEHSKIGEQHNTNITKEIKLALVGNQNSGKTTLFNKLTGLNQHVGNFPGVTIDKKDGIIKGNKNIKIIDLPGIYSLSPYSSEEIVTRNFILISKPDCIINIIDTTNIERNLLLTLQLLELNVPLVIALNMMDEFQINNGSIDINGLEKYLGVPVIPISAIKNEGIDELIDHAINVAICNKIPNKIDFCENNNKDSAIHRCIHSIMHQIENKAKDENIPIRFAATKIIENDNLIKQALFLEKSESELIEKQIQQMEDEIGIDRLSAIASMRFSFIEQLCLQFISKSQESKGLKLSTQLDKILTGKYTAFLFFILIISLILYITFGPVGSFLSSLITKGIECITNIADKLLINFNSVFRSLIIDGILAGVGSILSFLPIIIILFFFLSILEDTGYMARIAFVMDKSLRRIGLSGRSFVPLLIGFGCSVPAIMACRILPSERDRKVTTLLIPFISCSAKLPIYVFFTAAFFNKYKILVILSLYFIGIIVGIIFAYIIKNIAYNGNPVPFVMELPSYRFPSAVNIYRLIYSKSKNFIIKAFTIILFATIIIWFLKTFDYRLNIVQDPSKSLLANLGNIIVPIFKPLGISDWRVSTAFISGFIAKESVISTLTVLIGGNVHNISLYFTNLSVFVFLIFSLLYTPCVAAIATVKRELGTFYAISVIIGQCLIAWIISFVIYQIGLFINII